MQVNYLEPSFPQLLLLFRANKETLTNLTSRSILNPTLSIFQSKVQIELPHFFILCRSYFSSHTYMSLFVKMICRIAIVSSTSKYHTPNSLLLKKRKRKKKKEKRKKSSKRFCAHNWPNSGHSSRFRPDLPMSKSRP